jgi:hypothetical protein
MGSCMSSKSGDGGVAVFQGEVSVMACANDVIVIVML